MRTLLVVLVCATAAVASAESRRGNIAGRVAVLAGDAATEDRSGVLVYVEAVTEARRGPAKTHQMGQQDKAFLPPVLVIQKGDSVEFPNHDHIFHNVFSLSKGLSFDLGLHKSGTRPTTTFDRPGSADVFCNIHPQMLATIKVLDNGYFALSGRDGSFRIAGIPAGSHAVVAWTRNGKEQRKTVVVEAGQTAQASFEVVETRRLRIHVRKDGTPYPRY